MALIISYLFPILYYAFGIAANIEKLQGINNVAHTFRLCLFYLLLIKLWFT